jgi:O-antigen ligase
MKIMIFWWIALLQFWAPIPLGSNRPWAWNLLNLIIFIPFLLHLIRSIQRPARLIPPKKSWIILAPLIVTQLWLIIQIIPGLGSYFSHANLIPFDGYQYISLDVFQTQEYLIRGIALTCYAYLLFQYVNTEALLKKLLAVIVISGVFQATYAVFLVMSKLDPTPIFGLPFAERANGSFVYHNHLANYLVLCISVGMGLIVADLGKGNSEGSGWAGKVRMMSELLTSKKILIRFSIIIMVIALIMTKSRMGNSGFFASLAIVGFYSLFFFKRAPASLKYLIVSIFIIDMIVVGAIFGIDKVTERIENTSMTSETRDDVLEDGINIVMDFPITGTGAGSFYGVFPSYMSHTYSAFYDHAHNDYLQFAIEFGLPITLLLGFMWLFMILKNFHTMTRGRGKFNRAMAFGFSIALIHMLFHSTVDFSLQAPANSLLFICILVLSLQLPLKKSN